MGERLADKPESSLDVSQVEEELHVSRCLQAVGSNEGCHDWV